MSQPETLPEAPEPLPAAEALPEPIYPLSKKTGKVYDPGEVTRRIARKQPRKTDQRRKTWSLAEKVAICREVDKKELKKTNIAKKYGMNKSTLSTIYSVRDKLYAAVKQDLNLEARNLRSPMFPKVEKIVWMWFQTLRAHKIPITGKMVLEKAREEIKKLGLNIELSNGWMVRFLQRHKVYSSYSIRNSEESEGLENTGFTYMHREEGRRSDREGSEEEEESEGDERGKRANRARPSRNTRGNRASYRFSDSEESSDEVEYDDSTSGSSGRSSSAMSDYMDDAASNAADSCNASDTDSMSDYMSDDQTNERVNQRAQISRKRRRLEPEPEIHEPEPDPEHEIHHSDPETEPEVHHSHPETELEIHDPEPEIEPEIHDPEPEIEPETEPEPKPEVKPEPDPITKWHMENDSKFEKCVRKDRFILGALPLFYNSISERGLIAEKPESSSDKLTVVLIFNEDGTEKLRPTVIGRQSQEECLAGISPQQLKCNYETDPSARLSEVVFKRILRRLEQKAEREERHLCLLVDRTLRKCAAEQREPSRVELVFLPEERTHNPLVRGVAHAFRVFYRRFLVKSIISVIASRVSLDLVPRWTELQAVRHIVTSWHQIRPDSLRSSWRAAELTLPGGRWQEEDCSYEALVSAHEDQISYLGLAMDYVKLRVNLPHLDHSATSLISVDERLAALEQPVPEEEHPVHDLEHDVPEGELPALEGKQRVQEGEKPAHEAEQPADEGEQCVLEGEQCVQEGEKPAHEGEQPAHEGEQCVLEGKQCVQEGEQHVQEGEQPAHEGEQCVLEGEQRVVEGEQHIQEDEQCVQEGEQGEKPAREGEQEGDKASNKETGEEPMDLDSCENVELPPRPSRQEVALACQTLYAELLNRPYHDSFATWQFEQLELKLLGTSE